MSLRENSPTNTWLAGTVAERVIDKLGYRMTKSGVKKVAVVGAGIAGLSIAWALARRGVSVDVFDQGPIPNPVSSSFDEHRINRHAYGKLEGYSRLMPHAYRVWDELWADLGVKHYEETSGIYVLRQLDGWYERTVPVLKELGVSARDLSMDELSQKLPMIKTDGVERAVMVGGQGLLFPSRILTSLVVHLTRLGVRFHAQTRVTSMDPDAGKLVTEKDTHASDVIVVAAGAWIDRLVPSLRGVAVPSRQAVVFLAPPTRFASAWAQAPIVVIKNGPAGLYVLPPRSGTRLKVGDHRFSLTGNPDDDRKATKEDLRPVWEELKGAFRSVDEYDALEDKACFYTVTKDEAFIAQMIGRCGWAVSACSGHGFKLGPFVGAGVAAGILGDLEAHVVTEQIAGRPIPAG